MALLLELMNHLCYYISCLYLLHCPKTNSHYVHVTALDKPFQCFLIDYYFHKVNCAWQKPISLCMSHQKCSSKGQNESKLELPRSVCAWVKAFLSGCRGASDEGVIGFFGICGRVSSEGLQGAIRKAAPHTADNLKNPSSSPVLIMPSYQELCKKQNKTKNRTLVETSQAETSL